MTDDIIVHGKDAAEHDTRLNKVLQKLEDSGMTLNPDKCNFGIGMNRLEFMGFVLNQEVLIQCQNGQDRVISYASRSLSDVKHRYSQTEKEALGLVWACERFHQYLYGIDFELITDHRPLEFIYSPRSKPSARVERWILRLQNYNFKVKYEPGHTNIADPLSRLVRRNQPKTHSQAEDYVLFVIKEATATSAVPLDEIDAASKEDPEISQKVLRELEKIFATHGLPKSVTTDNGPQFISEDFERYMMENDINHRPVTPLWPSANGEVERQNRTLLKAMKIA
ncbi:hypothetical protein ACOMHN_027466 [Nucella lapillus]